MSATVFVITYHDVYSDAYEEWHDTTIVGVCSTEELAKKQISELGKTLGGEEYDEIVYEQDGLGVTLNSDSSYWSGYYASEFELDNFDGESS